MTQYLQNGLAAVAAIVLFAVSFASVVNVPADPAYAVASVSAPILA